MSDHSPTGPFDVFLSYARDDNHRADPRLGWVTALHQFIQNTARLPGGTPPRVFFDTADIRDYDDWRHRILAALRHSKVLLVCLSPNYFNSNNCRWEWEHFLKRQGPHARGEGETIQSVRFVELPTSVAEQNRAWLDSVRRGNTIDLKPWFEQGAVALQQEEKAQAEAHRAVEALLQRIRFARRELAREYGNLRAANEHFVGRVAQLRQLHEAVGVGRTGVITAVHGLGGIGKTELAVQYANDYARSFPGGIWWINAAAQRDLKICLASLIDDPRFPQPATRSTDNEQRYAHVIATLQAQAEQRRLQDPDGGSQVLILLDNVDHPELLGANQRSLIGNLSWLSLIATTRESAAAWAKADRLQVLELDALDPGDALALIREWQPGSAFAHAADEAAAKELCELLGCFTLAAEQAAIYLGTQAGASLQGFVVALKAGGLHQLDALARDPELRATMQHREKQLDLVLQQTLPATGSLERVLLDYAACWGPDAIPKPWIEGLVREQHANLLTSSGLGADPLANAWAWLGRRRLLTPTQWPELLRLHRLIATHLRTETSESSTQVLAQIDVQLARLEHEMVRQAIPAWRVEALQAWAIAAEAQNNRLRAATLLVTATYTALARSVSAAASPASQSLQLFEALALADTSNVKAQRDISVSLDKVGDIKAAQGDAPGALRAFQRSLEIREALARADPSSAQALRDISVALIRVGDITAAQGDGQAAFSALQRSLDIRETLANADPSNAQALRDLSISLIKVGDVKAAQGDTQGALSAFQRSLAIAETIAQADPSNAQALRDVLVGQISVGDIKAGQGDTLGAHSAYQRSLDIAEALARADPSNLQALRDVSVSLIKVGDIKAAQGDAQGALNAFQRGLDIAETRAKADPSNARAQRDVFVTLISVGDIKAAGGDERGALDSYLRSLDIAETLAKSDPSNAQALRDVSVSFIKLGDIKVAQGDLPGALCAFQSSLGITENIAKSDPSNAQALRDVLLSLQRVGDIKGAQGDAQGALSAYQSSLDTAQTLARADPSNSMALRDVSVNMNRIGHIKALLGDTEAALRAFQGCLDIAETLAQADSSNSLALRDLWVSHAKLWQLATEHSVERNHASEIDRIFSELESRSARISPSDCEFWTQVQQWLKDHP